VLAVSFPMILRYNLGLSLQSFQSASLVPFLYHPSERVGLPWVSLVLHPCRLSPFWLVEFMFLAADKGNLFVSCSEEFSPSFQNLDCCPVLAAGFFFMNNFLNQLGMASSSVISCWEHSLPSLPFGISGLTGITVVSLDVWTFSV